MSEHDLIRERERAHLAKQVLDNPAWQEAWGWYADTLKAHLIAPDSSDETVLAARQAFLILNKVKRHIEKAMETGKMAEIQLERLHGRTTDAGSVN